MTEERPETIAPQLQPPPNRGRGRGRGYHSDNTGRQYMARPREPYYPDNYNRGGFHQENRGRGYHDNMGRGYYFQNRGRGHQFEYRGRGHQFEHRGRGYRHNDSRAGAHYQEDEEGLIKPQRILDSLGVKDLREHLEKLRLEGRNTNNPQGCDDSGDEPRCQVPARGGARGRGRSGSRSRGRSEDRCLSQRWSDEPEQEIYINDVYNIKVEMATSTGKKTFKLDQEDHLSNLKHVPDYEAQRESYQPPMRPAEYHRGHPAARRGFGRGRGQYRGRGQIAHNYEYEPRTENHEGTFAQGGDGYTRGGRGKTRGQRNFDPAVRSRQFQRTRQPSKYTWKSGEPEDLKEDTKNKVKEPVVESEENWDLEIAKTEAAQKQSDVQQSEDVHKSEDNDLHPEDAGDGQSARVVDQLEHQADSEYYEGTEGYEEYEHYDENYECEGQEMYDTYYAEECEGYVKEHADATAGDSEFHPETDQQIDEVRATEVQNIDENSLDAGDVVNQVEAASNLKESDVSETTEEDKTDTANIGNTDDEHSLPQTESDLNSMENEDKAETSTKHVKKPKDKKKKVRINAP